MMADVLGFGGVPPARRIVASQLRELADIIASDAAETEPHGIVMCLMGATQFEVVCIGQTEGWSGAKSAMNAVLSARFDTIGGNIRQRHHHMYNPRAPAEVVPINVAQRQKPLKENE